MAAQLDQEQLIAAVVALSARLDALTWALSALIDSHPHPSAILAAWDARLDQASDGGFETDHSGYRERYAEELSKWSATLRARARR